MGLLDRFPSVLEYFKDKGSLLSPIGVMVNPRDVADYIELLSDGIETGGPRLYVSAVVNYTDKIVESLNNLSSDWFSISDVVHKDVLTEEGEFPLDKYIVDFGLAENKYKLYMLLRKQASYIENMEKIEGKDPYNYSILVFSSKINAYYPIMALLVELVYRLGSNLYDIIGIINKLKDPDNLYSMRMLLHKYLPYKVETPSHKPVFLHTNNTMRHYIIKRKGRLDKEFYEKLLTFASTSNGVSPIIGIKMDDETKKVIELLEKRKYIDKNQPKITINNNVHFYLKANITESLFSSQRPPKELRELKEKNKAITLCCDFFFIVPGLQYGDIVPKLS